MTAGTGVEDHVAALRSFVAAHPEAVGFVLGPLWFRFVRPADVAAMPDDWYLIRIFDSAAELTVERPPDGTAPSARRLDDLVAKNRGWERFSEYSRYLWGRGVVDPATSTVTLASGQVGTLWVPLSPGGTTASGDVVELKAVEYLSVDEHGNAVVVAERLTEIVVSEHREELGS